jgi:hypothetical protein
MIGRPDALFVSAARKRGPRLADRVASIADIAEPILEADQAAGQRAYIRQQGNDWLFISLSPHDTINFPNDHPRSGQPRYAWINQADGSRFGYLVEKDEG